MDDLWRIAWEERARLLRVARRRCRNRADAEEVVGEAMLRCVSYPSVRPADLPSMLTAVTMRLCVDRLRERAIAERQTPRLFTRPVDTTEEVLDRAEAVWLAAEIARLADRERAVLAARMFGLSLAETAEALGISYRAAEGLLGRARRKLRGAWTRTLGVLWPLRRRPKALALALVVAVTATLAVWRSWQERQPSRPFVVERARMVRTGATVTRPRRALATTTPIRPGTEHRAAASSARPLRLATPDLRAGPVRLHPTVVTVDLTDPVGRVERCVQNGVEVTVSETFVGVVCK